MARRSATAALVRHDGPQASLGIEAWLLSVGREDAKAPVVVTSDHVAAALKNKIIIKEAEGARDILEHRPTQRDLNVELLPTRKYNAFRNALQPGWGTRGGFLESEGFVPELEAGLILHSPVRQVATVIRVPGHDEVRRPLLDDDGEGYIVAPNTSQAADTDPEYQSRVWRPKSFRSGMVRVPFELYEDGGTAFSVGLAAALSRRVARIQNRYYTVGYGGYGGLVGTAYAGATAASATAIAFDDLERLVESVGAAYIERGGCQFMMNPATLSNLYKQKDGHGRYLWTDSVLARFPVTQNAHMSSTLAGGEVSVLFGAFDKYQICDNADVRVEVYSERYIEYGQLGFAAQQRSDGNLFDAGSHPISKLTH